MKVLVSLIALGLLPAAGLCATIYVPDDHATIQGAIDAAVNGDQVIVRPGTYVENIDFGGKAITVKSESGAGATTIDGNRTDCVVLFDDGEDKNSILDGFTITNGIGLLDSSDDRVGGGICCLMSNPTIINNRVTQNSVSHDGGGIYCRESSPDIVRNEIMENTADSGGGILCRDSSQPLIFDNVVSFNSASRTGGIKIRQSHFGEIYIRILNNRIEGNSSNMRSGLSCYRTNGEIRNNTILGNTSVITSGQVTVTFCEAITIDRNEIIGSPSQGETVGVYVGDGNATVSNNIIKGHSAYLGGGIICNGSAPLIVSNVIVDNEAFVMGGGISCDSARPIIMNNIIARNSAAKGGGLGCDWLPRPKLINNVFFGNSATECGGGIHIDRIHVIIEPVPMVNTIMWNNSAPLGPAVNLDGIDLELFVGFSNIEGGQASISTQNGAILNWGNGNIDDDPLFVDPAIDDFHIPWNSPCRNAGAYHYFLTKTDLDGDPRIADGIVDMGADEFFTHLYHTGQVLPGATIDIKVVGAPAEPVVLAWGEAVLDPPYPTQHGNLYIWPFVWSGFVGTVPSNGVLTTPVTIPSSWNPGDHAPLQALVGPWGGSWTRLTNLNALEVE